MELFVGFIEQSSKTLNDWIFCNGSSEVSQSSSFFFIRTIAGSWWFTRDRSRQTSLLTLLQVAWCSETRSTLHCHKSLFKCFSLCLSSFSSFNLLHFFFEWIWIWNSMFSIKHSSKNSNHIVKSCDADLLSQGLSVLKFFFNSIFQLLGKVFMAFRIVQVNFRHLHVDILINSFIS